MTPQRGVVFMAERTHTKEQAAVGHALVAWSGARLEVVVTRRMFLILLLNLLIEALLWLILFDIYVINMCSRDTLGRRPRRG